MPATKGNTLQELWVNIRADISSLRAGFTGAKAETRSFVGQMGLASKQLRKLGTNITLVSGALVGMGVLATTVFAKFQQSMANTQSVLGATSAELETLTGFAREMGKTTVFTASQAADAMFFLGQAGFKTRQIMASLEATLQLSAATQSDLAETTNIIVASLNQFGLSAEQASRVTNTFAAAISNSLANMEKLKESMKFVGPVAFQMGESIEGTVSALSKLFDAGLTASIAGTQLRQIFLRLIKPTKRAAQGLADLGISADDVNPQFKSLTDIVRKFQEAIPPHKLRESSDELKEIFGIRAVAAFSVLLQEGADSMELLQGKITDTNKAAEQARIQIDTLKGAWRLLISVLQEAAIQIGEILRPIMRGLMDTTRDLIQVFNDLPAILKQVVVIGGTLVGLLGLIIGPMLILASMIPKVVAGFGLLSGVFTALSGPIGLIIAGVAALGVLLFTLSGKERKQREETERSIQASIERLQAMREQQEGMKDLAAEFIKLDEQTEGSTELNSRQKEILDALNVLYPDLVGNVDNYAEAMEAVRAVIVETNREIKDLTDSQKQFAVLKINLNEVDVRNQLEELKSKFEKGSFFENLFGATIGTRAIQKQIDGLNFKNLITGLQTPGLLGEISVAKFTKALEEAIGVEEGLEKALEDRITLSNINLDAARELAVLNIKDRDNTIELTNQEKERQKFLAGIVKESESLDDAYGKVVGNLEAQKVLEENLILLAKKRNELLFGAPTDISEIARDSKARAKDREKLRQEGVTLAAEAALGERELMELAAIDEEIQRDKEEQERIVTALEAEIEAEELAAAKKADIAALTAEDDEKKAKDREVRAKRTAVFIISLSDIMGRAISGAALKLSDVWKSALGDLVDLIANTYKQILKATIALAFATFPPNIAAAAKAAVGIALISAAQATAKSLISSAAVGANVDRSGIVKVHAGETIVPAAITRSTRDDFRNRLLGAATTEDKATATGAGIEEESHRGIVIEGDLVLNNPQVDSPQYWREVIDNNLDEVSINRNKRFNKR